MTRLLVLMLMLFAGGPAMAIEAELGFDDPVMNERYRELLREVRCPKCLNTSIADSDAPIAEDLRREVHQKMAEGASDEEIVEYLVSRYGEFVVYRPPLQPTTWALWGGPVALLAIGAFVFARILRSRARQSIDQDAIS
ncbi:MAG: cytochrome c-type biogenesis protein CcmH [Gammaproteobacteria bacterium]|nr:cytochrome c-type biogenesis protein CcmH [Gammaproteobacteria bacterium]